jgi:glycosyltransferase involved in cell wall biosynthesis
MTTPDRSISVVLPVYLNRPHLPELYRRLTDVLGALTSRHELVFVDDAGPDGSLAWLQECRRRDERVVVVEMGVNRGQHRAVIEGLNRSSGGIVIVMDADLQDPPEAIPRLVQALGAGEGVVFARRVARHQGRGRHVTGLLFKRFMRLVAGSRIPAGTGMFFAATRQVVDAAVSEAAGARYVPLLLDRTGTSMTAIDVLKERREEGSSAYTWPGRLRLAIGAMRQAIEWRKAKRRASKTRDPRA